MTDSAPAPDWRGRTGWSREGAVPLREFLRTESASAGVLLAGVLAALVWANVDAGSYERLWHATVAVQVGGWQVSHDLRDWVNTGLMTLFFLVVGLEARRELDLGDLRERKRFVLPCLAGLAGMAVPVAIYLAINAGRPSAHGWGTAMSTDTALALGLLALLARDVPDRVRVFLLTVFVVDDLVALVIVGTVYTEQIHLLPLTLAVAAFGALVVATRRGFRRGWVYLVLGVAIWASMAASGVDPVVAGLVVGLSASARPPPRDMLESATGMVKLFREQPTSELARQANVGIVDSLSPNERLQDLVHPWTSFLIVPLFGFANAGIPLGGGFLREAYTAPITLGILVGYVVGKPVAVVGTSWLVTRISGRRIVPPVGWAAVLGSGTIAGIGFTVALLIADRAFTGKELAEAKLGALTAALVASVLTWAVYRATALLSRPARARAVYGDLSVVQDLVPAVDIERDHIRGPLEATATLIEFGDFECPHCGQAEGVARELMDDDDLRFVWRHLPLPDVHPAALLAAEAAEAASAQGAFWPMHDLLLDRQEHLTVTDLLRYAGELGLDVERFRRELARHAHAARVAQDMESADVSGATGTPTFFINGQRHYGAYDVASLRSAIAAAREQARARRSRPR